MLKCINTFKSISSVFKFCLSNFWKNVCPRGLVGGRTGGQTTKQSRSTQSHGAIIITSFEFGYWVGGGWLRAAIEETQSELFRPLPFCCHLLVQFYYLSLWWGQPLFYYHGTVHLGKSNNWTNWGPPQKIWRLRTEPNDRTHSLTHTSFAALTRNPQAQWWETAPPTHNSPAYLAGFSSAFPLCMITSIRQWMTHVGFNHCMLWHPPCTIAISCNQHCLKG